MKKNRGWQAHQYAFSAGEPVLIDANIWLYLQPPTSQPAPSWTKIYSQALRNLLTAKACPLVDALVLSEYANRYLRLEYAAYWQAKYPNFKAFRQSGDGQGLSSQVAAEAKQILTVAQPVNTTFEKADMAEVLGELAAGTLDFNDAIIVETCRTNGFKLLTNDADMFKGGIDVITNNKKLIAACL